MADVTRARRVRATRCLEDAIWPRVGCDGPRDQRRGTGER
jgi:hypothetical protein